MRIKEIDIGFFKPEINICSKKGNVVGAVLEFDSYIPGGRYYKFIHMTRPEKCGDKKFKIMEEAIPDWAKNNKRYEITKKMVRMYKGTEDLERELEKLKKNGGL